MQRRHANSIQQEENRVGLLYGHGGCKACEVLTLSDLEQTLNVTEVHYCSWLEDVAFQRKSAEYLWMLVCSAGMIVVLAYLFGSQYFVSGALIDLMTYLGASGLQRQECRCCFSPSARPVCPGSLSLDIPSDGRTTFLDSWWVIPTSSSRTFSFSRQSSCLTIRGRTS
ncbi:unnamed protein product [Cladocopium goreaui]|uniref:Derlin n=1 Tax=Cladocopium goreaui TaxID=2562237 RepID=A0A9P1DD45_9DINO|nr:unnamed protein product [Cladocopium goreaui]